MQFRPGILEPLDDCLEPLSVGDAAENRGDFGDEGTNRRTHTRLIGLSQAQHSDQHVGGSALERPADLGRRSQ